MNQRKKSKPAVRKQFEWVGLAIFAGYAVSHFVPWVPRSWQPPCNNSWVLVLHQAFLERRSFGTEIVFTFGPYGFLYFGAIPETYLYTLLGWLLLTAGYMTALWRALQLNGAPMWVRTLMALAVTLVTGSVDVVDAQIYVFATATLVCGLWPASLRRWEWGLIGISLALAALVKFSWLIAIVPVVAFVSVVAAWQRRLWQSPGLWFGVGAVVLWGISGQGTGDLAPFFQNSLEITSGYSQAMQLDHPWGMTNLAWYIAGSLFLIGMGWRRGLDLVWSIRTVAVGVTAYLLFIGFKAGFVRHDHHETVSMAMLLSVAVLLWSNRHWRIAGSVASVAALVLWTVVCGHHRQNPSFQDRWMAASRLQGMGDMLRFVTGGVDPQSLYREDLRPIAQRQPLPSLPGTVDLYPWGGVDAVFANGLEYCPRPVFESYSAYTAGLARLNRDYLESEQAPDHLLFAVRQLDGRFPAMDDGLSWPAIFEHYQLAGQHGGYLLLHKRTDRRPLVLESLGRQPVAAGKSLPLPDNGPVWMELELPRTARGKLASQVYRPAILGLRAELSNGRSMVFRIVPEVARAGVLISPILLENGAFAAFLQNPEDARLHPLCPRSLTVVGAPGFEADYDFDRAQVRWFRIRAKPPAENQGAAEETGR